MLINAMNLNVEPQRGGAATKKDYTQRRRERKDPSAAEPQPKESEWDAKQAFAIAQKIFAKMCDLDG